MSASSNTVHVGHSAVFTYGDKGLKVVAFFLVASVVVHLAELGRLKARSRGEN